MKLTEDNVHNLFLSLSYEESENKVEYVKAHGVIGNVGFHPVMLKEARRHIESMLYCLPKEFMLSYGRGWSFLNIGLNKNGKQWTGVHQIMDELVMMGLAIGKIVFLSHKGTWRHYPGGMPYLVVLDEEDEVDERKKEENSRLMEEHATQIQKRDDVITPNAEMRKRQWFND